MKLEQNLMLTDWFPPDVKPVRSGVYQIRDGIMDEDTWYSFWDGRSWGYATCKGANTAFDERFSVTDLPQNQHWRGLSKKP